MPKRTISTPLDQGSIFSIEHNNQAGAKKVLAAGPSFQKNALPVVDGKTGSFSIQAGTLLWIYNNSTTTGWVALSTQTIGSAPTGFANGIPLPPNSWSYINTGDNTQVYLSATAAAYIPEETTRYSATESL